MIGWIIVALWFGMQGCILLALSFLTKAILANNLRITRVENLLLRDGYVNLAEEVERVMAHGEVVFEQVAGNPLDGT